MLCSLVRQVLVPPAIPSDKPTRFGDSRTTQPRDLARHELLLQRRRHIPSRRRDRLDGSVGRWLGGDPHSRASRGRHRRDRRTPCLNIAGGPSTSGTSAGPRAATAKSPRTLCFFGCAETSKGQARVDARTSRTDQIWDGARSGGLVSTVGVRKEMGSDVPHGRYAGDTMVGQKATSNNERPSLPKSFSGMAVHLVRMPGTQTTECSGSTSDCKGRPARVTGDCVAVGLGSYNLDDVSLDDGRPGKRAVDGTSPIGAGPSPRGSTEIQSGPRRGQRTTVNPFSEFPRPYEDLEVFLPPGRATRQPCRRRPPSSARADSASLGSRRTSGFLIPGLVTSNLPASIEGLRGRPPGVV
jgi:hypothetical protein